MKVAIRKLNNSALLAKDNDLGTEVIVMGKGISFKYKQGQEIISQDIESIFVLQDTEKSEAYIEQFEQTSQEFVEITQRLMEELEKKFFIKMPEQLFILLMDHIKFAVYRCRHNIRIENRMIWTIERMYPAEFSFGLQAIKIIDECFDLKLPIEEAGNIAFHIINSKQSNEKFKETYSYIELQNDIISIVKYSLNIDFERKNLVIDRFLTHVQFFVQRLMSNETVVENDVSLFEKIIDDYPKEFQCSLSIRNYIIKKMNIEISQDELVYLTIHLVRLVNQKMKGE